jgi:hypothetical protein
LGHGRRRKTALGVFFSSGVRDGEMQNTEYADFNRERRTLHVQRKPWRHFGIKGKKKKKSARDSFISIPARLVWKIKDRMRERNAELYDKKLTNSDHFRFVVCCRSSHDKEVT